MISNRLISPHQETLLSFIDAHCHTESIIEDPSSANKVESNANSCSVKQQQGLLPTAPIVTELAFLSWWSKVEDLEAKLEESAFSIFGRKFDTLYLACQDAISAVTLCEEDLCILTQALESIQEKTGSLHQTCNRLVAEEQALSHVVTQISQQLALFDDLDRISRLVSGGGSYSNFSITSPSFIPTLQRIDECIATLSDAQNGDSELHSFQFRQVQSRAFSMIKTHFQRVLTHTAEKLSSLNSSDLSSSTASLNGDRHSPQVYVSFQALSPQLRPLFSFLEEHDSDEQYMQLQEELVSVYSPFRLQLLKPIVEDKLTFLLIGEGLVPMLRSGLMYISRLCRAEVNLFSNFFNRSQHIKTYLLEALCELFHDSLRPHYLNVTLSVDVLSTVVLTLLQEASTLRPGSSSDEALHLLLINIIADVRERLTKKAYQMVAIKISDYSPRPDEMNYPMIYRRWYKAAEANEEAPSWIFPPLKNTTHLLTCLFTTIDKEVFADIAYSATTSCLEALTEAADKISEIDSFVGKMFLVSHLYRLHEELVNLAPDIIATNTAYDFSPIIDVFWRVLGGGINPSNLIRLDSENAIVKTFYDSLPKVVTTEVLVLKPIASSLSLASRQVTMEITTDLLNPLLLFLAKVDAFTKVKAASSSISNIGHQAFAQPDKITNLLLGTLSSVSKVRPLLVVARLCMPDPSSWENLWASIKEPVLEAYSSIMDTLTSSTFDGVNISLEHLPTINTIGEALDSVLLNWLEESLIHTQEKDLKAEGKNEHKEEAASSHVIEVVNEVPPQLLKKPDLLGRRSSQELQEVTSEKSESCFNEDNI